jgi:hypothetical protein
MKAIDRYIEDQKRSIRYKKLIDFLTDKSSSKKGTEKAFEIAPGIDND